MSTRLDGTDCLAEMAAGYPADAAPDTADPAVGIDSVCDVDWSEHIDEHAVLENDDRCDSNRRRHESGPGCCSYCGCGSCCCGSCCFSGCCYCCDFDFGSLVVDSAGSLAVDFAGIVSDSAAEGVDDGCSDIAAGEEAHAPGSAAAAAAAARFSVDCFVCCCRIVGYCWSC